MKMKALRQMIGVVCAIAPLLATVAAVPIKLESEGALRPSLFPRPHPRPQPHHEVELNDRPVIGIFAQPNDTGVQYIAASYVKWIEAAGALVVPIPYNASNDEMDKMFSHINGLLLPGGAAAVSAAASYMVNKAIEANDQGDYFPVWGTCLGHEWLLQIVAGDNEVLDHKFDSWNMSLPLHLTPGAFRSTLLGTADGEMMYYLTQLETTMNNHEGGIEPKNFLANERLVEFFEILSINFDRKGRPFISTMEAKNYPIWGVQWHPEKNSFEWGIKDNQPFEAINHSREAIRVTQWTANFFVDHARLNKHRFPDLQTEMDSLIYKYQPSLAFAPHFMQTYYFPEWPVTKP